MAVFERKEGISEVAVESLGCEIESGVSLGTEREGTGNFWLSAGEGEDLDGRGVFAAVGSVPFK